MFQEQIDVLLSLLHTNYTFWTVSSCLYISQLWEAEKECPHCLPVARPDHVVTCTKLVHLQHSQALPLWLSQHSIEGSKMVFQIPGCGQPACKFLETIPYVQMWTAGISWHALHYSDRIQPTRFAANPGYQCLTLVRTLYGILFYPRALQPKTIQSIHWRSTAGILWPSHLRRSAQGLQFRRNSQLYQQPTSVPFLFRILFQEYEYEYIFVGQILVLQFCA